MAWLPWLPVRGLALALMLLLDSVLQTEQASPNHIDGTKSVSVLMRSSWRRTSLLQEASEFFADIDSSSSADFNGLFWSFLTRVRILQKLGRPMRSDKDEFEIAMQIGHELLRPTQLQMLELSLSLRYNSPRIEMYRQVLNESWAAFPVDGIQQYRTDDWLIFSQCGVLNRENKHMQKDPWDITAAFAQLCNEARTSETFLSANAIAVRQLAVDHILPALSSNNGVTDAENTPILDTIIVYGDIRSATLWPLLDYLREQIGRLSRVVVFRHFEQPSGLAGSPPVDQRVNVAGYGIELTVKSTEYRAEDDRRPEQEEGEDEAARRMLAVQRETQRNEVLSEANTHKLDDVHGILFAKLQALHPEKSSNISAMRGLLSRLGAEIVELKQWQYQDLSFKAAAAVLHTYNEYTGSNEQRSLAAMKRLRELSQNFPLQAHHLLRQQVSDQLRQDTEHNQMVFSSHYGIEVGDSAFLVNGLYIDVDSIDVFQLYELLLQENIVMQALGQLGLASEEVADLLRIDLRPDYARYGIDIRHRGIKWINNLEIDDRYASWSDDIRDLMRHTFPPQLLKPIRKNIFNVVLVVNASSLTSSITKDVVSMLESFYVHEVPLRIGLVLVAAPQDAGARALIRGFHVSARVRNPGVGLSFLSDVLHKVKAGGVTVDQVKAAFVRRVSLTDWDDEMADHLLSSTRKAVDADENAVNVDDDDDADSMDDADEAFTAALEFTQRLGSLSRSLPVALLNGVPLSGGDGGLDTDQSETTLNAESFESDLLTEVMKQSVVLQTAVQTGAVSSSSNMAEWLSSQQFILPSLSYSTTNSGSSRAPLDLSARSVINNPSEFNLMTFSGLRAREQTSAIVETMRYVSKRDAGDAAADRSTTSNKAFLHAVTIWAVVDPSTAEGRRFMRTALKFVKSSTDTRLGFVYDIRVNTADKDADAETADGGESEKYALAKLIQTVIETQTSTHARNFIFRLLAEENAAAFLTAVKQKHVEQELAKYTIEGMSAAALASAYAQAGTEFFVIHGVYARNVLNIAHSDVPTNGGIVVTNGRIFNMPPNAGGNTTVSSDDFGAVEKLLLNEGAARIRDAFSSDDSLSRKMQRSSKSISAASLQLFNRKYPTASARSDFIMRVLSVMSSPSTAPAATASSSSAQTARAKRRIKFDDTMLRTDHAVIVMEPRSDDSSAAAVDQQQQPAFEFDIVMDPLSRDAQKLSHILIVLYQLTNARIRLFLNCRSKLSEMPLKTFYRFVLDARLPFDPQSGNLNMFATNLGRFHTLPHDALLSTNIVHAPGAWLPDSSYAVHDLDNIRLRDITTTGGVYAEFELQYLLVEGSARDMSTGTSTRGVQLELGTWHAPHWYDTLVMANLGYFQLKANPGLWRLALRPASMSSEIFRLFGGDKSDASDSAWSSTHAVINSTDTEKQRGIDVQEAETAVYVLLSSFSGKIIKFNVVKRPGMEKADVLSEVDGSAPKSAAKPSDADKSAPPPSIFGSLKNSLFGSGDGQQPAVASTQVARTGETAVEQRAVSEQEGEILNIFSVASGHLYERLLRVMMLTVLKQTKTPVKFWFLRNYLSPDFKAFLPHMARTYGFKFELVQYKWPRWLNAQTDKQRIIWGYKILFLDVLFPLDVRKIIFVDADQVVRTDLKELRDMDLDGAPYGYTPFCDSRTDMDGYRFWRSGYWRQHLGPRKYHISALYVVDLIKFRRIAAGDRLRTQYQALSQDPNSLANLDQDLPNNMIHQVPIKSLPQDWLWCETWCDEPSKKRAKTIDLCNNPQTKEPKLQRAMRITEEWPVIDADVQHVYDEWKKSTSSKAASSSSAQQPSTTILPSTPSSTTTAHAVHKEL